MTSFFHMILIIVCMYPFTAVEVGLQCMDFNEELQILSMGRALIAAAAPVHFTISNTIDRLNNKIGKQGTIKIIRLI